MRISEPNITDLKHGQIFVFGSNVQGYHQGGAAKLAHEKFGAKWGVGVGLTGQTYAIPTIYSFSDAMKPFIDDFIVYAIDNPIKDFLITEIGCGIAGFTPEEIAPMFAEAISIENIFLPKRFYDILTKAN